MAQSFTNKNKIRFAEEEWFYYRKKGGDKVDIRFETNKYAIQNWDTVEALKSDLTNSRIEIMLRRLRQVGAKFETILTQERDKFETRMW